MFTIYLISIVMLLLLIMIIHYYGLIHIGTIIFAHQIKKNSIPNLKPNHLKITLKSLKTAKSPKYFSTNTSHFVSKFGFDTIVIWVTLNLKKVSLR